MRLSRLVTTLALWLALGSPAAADIVAVFIDRAMIRGGTIEIDGQGSYFIDDDGEAFIDLPPGRYRYAIDFAGRRFEGEVTLRGGSAQTVIHAN